MQLALQIVLIVSSVLLVLLILLHRGRGGGLSSLFGGGVQSSLSGSSVVEKNLDRLTLFVGGIWVIAIVGTGLLVEVGAGVSGRGLGRDGHGRRNAIRGTRVGAGPMGESERGETAPRSHISYYCANGHVTTPSFAAEADIPELLGLPPLRPAGRAGRREPARRAAHRAIQDAPGVREGAAQRRRRRRHPRGGAGQAPGVPRALTSYAPGSGVRRRPHDQPR